jgi:hypothetical protein
MAEAVEQLPRFLQPDTQIDTQNFGASCHSMAAASKEALVSNEQKTPVNIGDCHDLALAGSSWKKEEVMPRLGLQT